jgi:hypothetical protein
VEGFHALALAADRRRNQLWQKRPLQPAKWSRRVFWLRSYEDRISCESFELENGRAAAGCAGDLVSATPAGATGPSGRTHCPWEDLRWLLVRRVCGFRRLRPGIPIERDHAFAGAAQTIFPDKPVSASLSWEVLRT